ncbi:MAG: prepilin-type cleavage/methylation domain-containing protein [Piscirickettsiaceae bacterium]|nr:MAG: prepilin-type cleavage/methylation domain-containing protein [Piscirickettsiaceae bacterium]
MKYKNRLHTFKGFTLIELLSVVAIIGILASLGQAAYYSYVERTSNILVIAEMSTLQDKIDQYVIVHGSLPPDLSVFGSPMDPWGNPYQYTNFETISGNGLKRKDHSLVPINTDYDLFSMGPDGRSSPPLTARHSRDDIIRANNGAFFGVASSF